MSELVGGVEAGGTKFVCAIGTGPDDVRAIERFPTTTPNETLGRVIQFFEKQSAEFGAVRAIGVGSFGPVDPKVNSPTYGYITSTPKPGWRQTNVVDPLRKALGVPISFDTDVNAAALGEWEWGAASGLDCFIYLTIGTGIGGGGVINGKLMHGLIHPEMGHVRIPHDLKEDPYPGHCPFHQDCLEGLAAGPAIAERWNQPGEELPEDHPAWELEAKYLSFALVNFICTLSPERIVLGGGVMRPLLYEAVRTQVQDHLAGYVDSPSITESIDQFIVPPALGNQAGVLGAIALAKRKLNEG